MTRITPRKAILLECRKCVGGNSSLCVSPTCKLYPYRLTRTEGKAELSPLQAIKAHCDECTGYDKEETKNCTGTECYLFPFRLGRLPKGMRKGATKEEMQGVRHHKIHPEILG
jgi:hypothetical protein